MVSISWYLDRQAAGNNGPLYPKVDHYKFKVAHNYEPLALQVLGLLTGQLGGAGRAPQWFQEPSLALHGSNPTAPGAVRVHLHHAACLDLAVASNLGVPFCGCPYKKSPIVLGCVDEDQIQHISYDHSCIRSCGVCIINRSCLTCGLEEDLPKGA